MLIGDNVMHQLEQTTKVVALMVQDTSEDQFNLIQTRDLASFVTPPVSHHVRCLLANMSHRSEILMYNIGYIALKRRPAEELKDAKRPRKTIADRCS